MVCALAAASVAPAFEVMTAAACQRKPAAYAVNGHAMRQLR